MTLKRSVTIDQILKQKFVDIELPDDFKKLLGEPERSGVWLIWGESFNGKTSFALQLAKALTKSGKVFYNTLEEGARKSMQKAVFNQNMKEVKKRFQLGDRENIEMLTERLAKKKSADIIFVDSIQYTEMTKKQYKALKEMFPNKLFIFISHADGKHPEGALAKFVKYDADVKIRVEGFKAICLSRLGGENNPYIINQERAAQYDIKIQ